jgi:acetyltransferase-like isoleucine patch superfamily enzyme
MSHPAPAKNWRERLLYWCGRRLAQRHGNVTIPTSCRIHPGAKINPRQGTITFGENCLVGDGAIIQGNVQFGDNCSVQPYTILTGYGTVQDPSGLISIGNGVRIASHGMMIAANHNFSDVDKTIHSQGLTHAPITIEDDVWIGGRVNVTAGITISHGCVIGGGSVVTKSIPPMSIAVGAPAKVIKTRGAASS